MKKLTIKPFKSGPKLPSDFKEKTWEKLRLAVASVYEKKAIKESKEELYRAVEDLCMHKLGNWLPKLYLIMISLTFAKSTILGLISSLTVLLIAKMCHSDIIDSSLISSQ